MIENGQGGDMTNEIPPSTELDAGQSFLGAATDAGGSVRCVFSSLGTVKIGTGTTTRKHRSKLYWFVEQMDEGFFIRQLNKNKVPAGDGELIDRDQLLSGYAPEVEMYEQETLPAMKSLNEHLDCGESLRRDGRLYSAESCLEDALTIEERNVRALFNLGLIYLERHEPQKARDMMYELLKIRASFTGKDQHLFNEFGIALRKAGLFDEAYEYFSKAKDFVIDDENLFYNLARINYERGEWELCVDALGRSRSLNPDLHAANKLASLVVGLSERPEQCERRGKPPVPLSLIDILNCGVPADGKGVAHAAASASVEGRARSGVSVDDLTEAAGDATPE